MIRALLLLLAMAGAQAQPAGLPTREGLPTLAPILEKVTPAVVNIAVLQRSPEEENPLLRDPFFRRFFGAPQQAEPQVAAGSGVIVDAKNGYVITNAHVVKDAREILITLRDNRRLPAKLVGADPGTDIALVRVEPKNLVDVKFGDSDAMRVFSGSFMLPSEIVNRCVKDRRWSFADGEFKVHENDDISDAESFATWDDLISDMVR